MRAGSLAQRAFNALDLLVDRPDTSGAGLGVAVSGGSDSLALLLLAADWARANSRRLVAATVDHGLRPEAAAEARHVAGVCRDLGVAHETLPWRPGPAHIAQTDARDARHALLAAWANRNTVETLAIGHTQDDRIETFLIRARAGSGWYGLAAPLPSSANPVAGGPRLVRPLLSLARSDLQAWLRDRGARWIDDPSNAAPRFERVRMRALAQRLPPASRASLIRSLDRLCDLRAAAMAEAAVMCAPLDDAGPVARLDAGCLGRMGEVARLRLLEALVLAAGGGRSPPPLGPLQAVCADLGAGRRMATVNVGGALLRASSGGQVEIGPEPPRRGARPAAAPACKPDGSKPVWSKPVWARAADLLADPRLAALRT